MARALVKEIKDTRKNYIINGDMRISQRGTSFASVTNGAYTLDRYIYYKAGAMAHTITQDTDVPTLAQAGYLFQNSLRLNLTTPDTTIAASDVAAITQKIEGYNWANLAQKPFTLSFWVKATLSGTYCVAFQNSGNDRSYVAEYTISSANTWEYKTITVSASPSAGTWNYGSGIGLEVNFTLAAGTNYQQTAGTWQTNAGAKYATTNQINGVNTGATDFRITGVCLNEGSAARAFSTFGESFGEELSACRRYYEKSYAQGTNPGTITQTGAIQFGAGTSTHRDSWVTFVVEKRAQPIINFYSPDTGTIGTARNRTTSSDFAMGVGDQGTNRFNASNTLTAGQHYAYHYTAEAEL